MFRKLYNFFLRHSETALLLAFMVAGVVAIIVVTQPYIIGLTPDSVNYLAAARGFAAGHGLHMADGGEFVVWPPLYPAVLSISNAFGIGILQFARFLNVFLFALIIWQAGRLAQSILKTRLFLVVFLTLVTFSGVVVSVSSSAWTEALFIVCTIVFLRLVLSSFNNPSTGKSISIIVCIALATMTRYIGIVLAFVFALSYRELLRYARLQRRQVMLIGILSVVPLGVWALRNVIVSGTFFGQRVANTHGLWDQLRHMLHVGSSWLVIDSLTMWVRIGVAAFFIAGTVWLYRRISRSDGSVADPALRVVVLFIGAYILFVVPLTLIGTNQYVDHRYLSPVYVPVVIVLMVYMERIFNAPGYFTIKTTYFAVAAILLASVLIGGSLNVVYPYAEASRVVRDQSWRSSSFVAAIYRLPAPGAVYSNFPYQAYLLTGRQVQFAPLLTEDAAHFDVRRDQNSPYVILFDAGDPSSKFHDRNWLINTLGMHEVLMVPSGMLEVGGTIYSF